MVVTTRAKQRRLMAPSVSASPDYVPKLGDGLEDFTICSGTDHRIMVHVSVLSDRSKILKAMLNADMLEASEGQITLRYLNKNELIKLVDYLYRRDFVLSASEAKTLVIVADQYELKGLFRACQDRLVKEVKPTMTPEDAAWMAKYARLLNMKELLSTTLMIMHTMMVRDKSCSRTIRRELRRDATVRGSLKKKQELWGRIDKNCCRRRLDFSGMMADKRRVTM